jgi:hypothetical protein
MTDIQSARERFRELEEKLQAVGLTPEEHALWEELRRDFQEDPVTASFPVAPGFDTWGSAPDAAETGTPAPPVPETTSVLWERGPVLQPEAPLSDIAAPPPIPAADPSYAAVEVPEEAIPEAAADDVQEIPDEPPATEPARFVETPVATEEVVVALAAAPAEEPPAETVTVEVIAAVAWVDDLGDDGSAVSLDALGVTAPPPSAESLAPPLPPPMPEARPAPVQPPDFPAAPARPERDPFDAPPSFVAGEHRIVLHTMEGQVLRGSIANADLEDPELPMIQPNGAVARIPAETVKAIFFMLPPGQRPPEAHGTRVRVTFSDGRQVSGVAPDYSPSSGGFFVLPLDARTNTARVWVYRAAVRQISVG